MENVRGSGVEMSTTTTTLTPEVNRAYKKPVQSEQSEPLGNLTIQIKVCFCSRVWCVIYSVRYSMHCTMYNVHIHCTMYNVHIQCTLYNVQYTLYNVQCTMYSIHCTM